MGPGKQHKNLKTKLGHVIIGEGEEREINELTECRIYPLRNTVIPSKVEAQLGTECRMLFEGVYCIFY
jgi:hypothetical protein